MSPNPAGEEEEVCAGHQPQWPTTTAANANAASYEDGGADSALAVADFRFGRADNEAAPA